MTCSSEMSAGQWLLGYGHRCTLLLSGGTLTPMVGVLGSAWIASASTYDSCQHRLHSLRALLWHLSARLLDCPAESHVHLSSTDLGA
jgi:hypothetical protein